jgi:hypothetical protein
VVQQAPSRPTDSTQPPAQFDDLGTAAATLMGLNKALAPVFSALKQLDTSAASDAGATQEFTPANLPASSPVATFRLEVRSIIADLSAWRLDAKPLGSSDASYQAVAAGTMGNLIADHRGNGAMVVGFTQLNGVNPGAFPATGRVIIAAAQGQNQTKAVLTRLVSFSPDGVAAPQTAVFAGDRTADGVSHVRILTQADVVAGPAGVEQITDRIAWMPKGGGGSYAFITGGDVDANKYLMARSCWANKNQLVFRDWRACDTTRAPMDCLNDASTVVRVDAGSSPSMCTGPMPQLPASVAAYDGPTESSSITPPTLPADLPLQLP